jgi:hypothetical protein
MREARPAGLLIRALAACLDAAAGVGLAVLGASTLGMFFAHRAVATLHIGEPGTWWKGPIPLMLGVFGEVVYLLPFTFLLVWLSEPLSGATIGKRLLGLRVRCTGGPAASPSALWQRFAIQTVGFWGLTVSLLAGRWEIAAVALVCGAAVMVAGLHSRLSATRVWRVA